MFLTDQLSDAAPCLNLTHRGHARARGSSSGCATCFTSAGGSPATPVSESCVSRATGHGRASSPPRSLACKRSPLPPAEPQRPGARPRRSSAQHPDVILESVGGPSLSAAIGRLAPHGTLVVLGRSSTEPATIQPLFYAGTPRAKLQSLMLFLDLEREMSGTRDLAMLAGLLADGSLDPKIVYEGSWRKPGEPFDS